MIVLDWVLVCKVTNLKVYSSYDNAHQILENSVSLSYLVPVDRSHIVSETKAFLMTFWTFMYTKNIPPSLCNQRFLNLDLKVEIFVHPIRSSEILVCVKSHVCHYRRSQSKFLLNGRVIFFFFFGATHPFRTETNKILGPKGLSVVTNLDVQCDCHDHRFS